MNFNVDSLLKDKNVLRIVALLSVLNLLGYLMMQNLDAVAFFVIIGFLTTYFSKNMIIVLLVAMVTTNFLVASRNNSQYSTIEGMKNKGRPTTKPSGDSEEEEEKLATGKDSTLTDAAPVIDQKKTVEEAYNNLESLVGPGGISKMTDDTQALIKKQKDLKEAMKGLPDMMDQVKGMMDQMGGMEGMNSMLENLKPAMDAVSKITGGTKKGGEKDLEGFAIRR